MFIGNPNMVPILSWISDNCFLRPQVIAGVSHPGINEKFRFPEAAHRECEVFAFIVAGAQRNSQPGEFAGPTAFELELTRKRRHDAVERSGLETLIRVTRGGPVGSTGESGAGFRIENPGDAGVRELDFNAVPIAIR